MKWLEEHPAALSLPLGARFLWNRALEVMREQDQSVLRFDQHIPSLPELAVVLSVSLAELQEYLPSLITRGLLAPDDSGALYSPLVLEMQEKRQVQAERRRAIEEGLAQRGGEPDTARARASRTNGACGGRPRSSAPGGQHQAPPSLTSIKGGLS